MNTKISVSDYRPASFFIIFIGEHDKSPLWDEVFGEKLNNWN